MYIYIYIHTHTHTHLKICLYMRHESAWVAGDMALLTFNVSTRSR